MSAARKMNPNIISDDVIGFVEKKTTKMREEGFVLVAVHVYCREDGEPIYWKVRLKHPDKPKWIRALSHNADGIFQMKEPDFASVYPDGNGKKPLYRLPDIVAAAPDAVVYIVEGEQKADALAALGLVATTSGGSNSTNTTHWQPLAGRSVRIWPDHDTAGQSYAREVAAALLALGCAVEVIDTDALNLEPKGDAVDWLAAHPKATAADVLALAVRTEVRSETAANDALGETDEQVIARLAGLSKLAYFRIQKASAEALGVTAANLDKLVAEERKRQQVEGNGEDAAGQDLIFENVEPWPDPVDGAELLDEITATVRRFTVLSLEQARAVALWSAFTWFIEAAKVAPMLNITSPEKRCGKSTLLLVIGELAAKPILASNITAAALFRCIEAWTPTLLIDETDAFLNEKEELRGVLNAGHYRKTAFVIRTVGDDHEPKRFITWCAKVLCGIGKIAYTLTDRSIIIEMRRKLAGEKVENIHLSEDHGFGEFRSRLLRWRDDLIEDFRALRPERIAGINDRAADNWQPLQAVAALAGGHWPEQCRQAAIVLSGIESDAPSINVELLMDCAEAFHAQNTAKMFTADLLDALNADEEKPWAAWNRGKPLNAHQLSKRLSEFGIKPGEIRIGQMHKKGYTLQPFNEAIIRYGTTSATLGDETATPRQPMQDKAFGPNEKRDNAENVADSKSPEPLRRNECRGVAFPEEVEL